MVITVKLFASLASHLPAASRGNQASITVGEGSTVSAILDALGVPLEQRHIVLVDGVYLPPEERGLTAVAAGQVIAVWPMIAGG